MDTTYEKLAELIDDAGRAGLFADESAKVSFAARAAAVIASDDPGWDRQTFLETATGLAGAWSR